MGIARQWAAVESWAASGKLPAGAARHDPRGRRRHPAAAASARELPDGWDDSLTYEISGAHGHGPGRPAGNLASLAWNLGTRLAGNRLKLLAGVLTRSKARLIAQLLEPLDEQEAARAEALILDELPGKTYPQVGVILKQSEGNTPHMAITRRDGAAITNCAQPSYHAPTAPPAARRVGRVTSASPS